MAEQAKLKPDPIADFYQGGSFCSMEFDRDQNKNVKPK
jgi:uronate dehydrogenase